MFTNNATDDSVTIQMWSEFLDKTLREESRWIQIAFIISMIIIFIVSLIGNLLTCIVIYYDKSMHTATNYYLFNLAVSDLIVTFAMLIEIHEYLNDHAPYHFGSLTCKIQFFFVVALWNNSIMIMSALAIERYIAIWYPLILKSSPVWRRVIKIIVLIWIVAILETLPEIWTVELIKTPKSSICAAVPTTFVRMLNGVLALLTFVIPLAIMTFVYAMIAFKVNVTVRKNSRDKIFNHRDNRSKVNKLIALTLSFLICWLPFFTTRVLIFTFDMRQLMQMPEMWGAGYKIVMLNSCLSMVVNPLLFSLMSTKFRKALKTLWRTKIKNKSHATDVQTIAVV